MAPVRRQTSKKGKKKMLVRGPDGALYLLSDKDLAPFKLKEEKEKAVEQNLRDAGHRGFIDAKLPINIIREIQHLLHCVSTGATHCGIIVEL
jgi:hypothetical protein